MSHPITTEPSAPPIQDHLPPPSPRAVPFRTTPTSPTPIACVTSSVPRPRLRPSFPASRRRQLHVLRVLHSAVHARDRRHPRCPRRRLDARPLHGINARENVDVVVVNPFFEAGITGPVTGPGAPPFPRMTGRTATSDVGGLQELVLPVATTVDSIPEADARKASEVAPAETKSRYAEGDGRADVKEATVPQVASLLTPTTEAAPGPAQNVTISDEGVVNVRLRLSCRILSLHPLRGR